VWVIIWLLTPWRQAGTTVGTPQESIKIPFRTVLKQRETWVFVLMRFLLDPVMYFMMFWIPKYLSEARNVPFEQIGTFFWIPFLALGISNILGGLFSDQLVKRDVSTGRARKIIMGCAAALTLAVPLTEYTSSVAIAVALMALYMFAHGCWITNYITAISDVFGPGATSTVVGLSGTAGALSSLLLNPMIGKIIQEYSYKPLWIASGLLYPVAFIAFILLIPRLKPLFDRPEEIVAPAEVTS
jgi:ACS family hexuronate transporter-like MFS transporter